MPETKHHKTISEQLLTSFDPLAKIRIDLEVRLIATKHPELLSILNFYEDVYRVGNFISGRYLLQTEKMFLMQQEIERLKSENDNLKNNIK